MVKIKLLPLLILMVISFGTRADHNAGGELTWECLSNGKFKFTLRLYRFCEGIPLGNTATVFSSGPVSSISLTRTTPTDISPKCYDSTKWMNCYGTNSNFTIEESIYTSGDIQISGVPTAAGWEFYWSSCCRPAPLIYNWGNIVDNLEPQNQSYRIKATMYPYNGTNTYPCYDSSPTFAEKPATIICTGYPFTYNHNAIDKDLDSLSYAWTAPLLSSGASVSYATHLNTNQSTPRTFGGNFIVPSPGFSATLPLPWSHSNMNTNNVPASINVYTGEINFTSYTTGQYATAVNVSAYRCGIKIAEIMRDIPIILLSCPPTPTLPPLSNTPPAVVFKWFANAVQSIPLPAGDTVLAGDSVEFYITSTDVQFLPGFIGQTNYLIPGGSQFGTNFSNPNSGCSYPPCAIIDTNSTFYNSSKNWWEGQYGIAARFAWKTSCNHLTYVDSCFTRSNKYNFVFKVLDNWCPAPGANFQTFTVTVLAPPAIPAPNIKCANVLPNGSVKLSWDQPVNQATDSFSSFRKYIIYRSDSMYGTYDSLHVLLDIDSIEYIDVTANALNIPKYYFVQGISSCNDQSVRNWSDTISSLRLTSQVINSGSSVALAWNPYSPGNKFPAKTTGQYYIWHIFAGDTVLIDSTTEFIDTIQVAHCYPSNISYFIEVRDTTKTWGCSSFSNASGGTVGDNSAPSPVLLDSVSYDVNGDINMSWSSINADISYFYIYKGGVLLDSVGSSTFTYTYSPTASDPCAIPFSISANDTCGNVGSPGLQQYSSCTRIVEVATCDTNKHITVSWDRYNPSWPGGTASHIVWVDTGSGWTILATVNGLDTSYNDTSIVAPTTYKYRVTSVETGTGRTATSRVVTYFIPKIIDGTIVINPDFRCVSWQSDTEVKLTWIQPPNPGLNFDSYHIYHSPTGAAGTFTRIDSILGLFRSDNLALGTTTYVHTTTPGPHFYQVKSRSGCDGYQFPSAAGRKLAAIDLSITKFSDEMNRLEWNPITSPNPIVTPSPDYTVWRDNPATPGVFSNFAQKIYGDESLQDTIYTCDDTYRYYVTYPDFLGNCESSSLIDSGLYNDVTPPSKQYLDSVSIIPGGAGAIGWQKNTSPNVVAYLVVKCNPSGYEIIDTLLIPPGPPPPGSGYYWYLDMNNAPIELRTGYAVVAVDNCGNFNLKSGELNCHYTIDLKYNFEKCEKKINLTWNAYSNFTSGPEVEYRIYLSYNGGAMNEIARTTETKFQFSNGIVGNEYCFQVQAWENNGIGPFSSTSDIECIFPDFVQEPKFAYLKYVTVVDNKFVRMCMKSDISGDIDGYWIKRSAARQNKYELVGDERLPTPLAPADSLFCFDDPTATVSNRSYDYAIEVLDPCGSIVKTSNIGRTIHLAVEANEALLTNKLYWNEYEDWSSGVFAYVILRGQDAVNFEIIDTIPAGNPLSVKGVEKNDNIIIYSDKLPGSSSSAAFCYRIIAMEKSGSSVNGESSKSLSNEACADQSAFIFIPTSFTPNGDGLNDLFQPYGSFVDLSNYSFEVYNRWGERIYSTNDFENGGWDGTYNGSEAPNGAYVYIVRYASADGQSFEDQGSVTLTR